MQLSPFKNLMHLLLRNLYLLWHNYSYWYPWSAYLLKKFIIIFFLGGEALIFTGSIYINLEEPNLMTGML